MTGNRFALALVASALALGGSFSDAALAEEKADKKEKKEHKHKEKDTKPVVTSADWTLKVRRDNMRANMSAVFNAADDYTQKLAANPTSKDALEADVAKRFDNDSPELTTFRNAVALLQGPGGAAGVIAIKAKLEDKSQLKPLLWKTAGIMLDKRGDNAGAVQCFEISTGYDAKDADAWKLLATSYEKVGKTAESQDALAKAHALSVPADGPKNQTKATSKKKKSG